MKEWFRKQAERFVSWFAPRLDFVVIPKPSLDDALDELVTLVQYTERSGFLNQDRKAKRKVQQRALGAIERLDRPTYRIAADVILGRSEKLGGPVRYQDA